MSRDVETVVQHAKAMFSDISSATKLANEKAAQAADIASSAASSSQQALQQAKEVAQQIDSTAQDATQAKHTANVATREGNAIKNEVAHLELELKSILETSSHNMLSVQEQVSEMRTQAQSRDNSMTNEMQQIATSNVQLRASVDGSINKQSDKFESLIRSVFETQREEI